MSDTQNAPEGSESSRASQQAWRAERIVTDFRTREHARRRRNWARKQLEAMATAGSVEVVSAMPDTGDYWRDVGMTLGMPERRAAGLALLGAA